MLSPSTSVCCPLNLVPTTSVIVGGVGVPFQLDFQSVPMRLLSVLSTLLLGSKDPSLKAATITPDSSHLSGINDVTPTAFDIETKCPTYRGDFHSWQIHYQQVSGVLFSWDFENLNFAFSHQVLMPQHCNIDVSDFPKACSLADPLASCCRSKL